MNNMIKMGSDPQFKFHKRCRKLFLNHLDFADDLMLFCKGEIKSTSLISQGLNTFAAALGLCANPSKSVVYLAGISNRLRDHIAHKLNMSVGSLPFKYLRFPLSSKRLSNADCDLLVHKMMARVRSWCNKNLSYAARLQLVQLVHMRINIYWCMIFVLP